jgi:hypothetical protein
VKNVSICKLLECEEDKLKVLVLINDPNSDLRQLAKILCDEKLLSNELNFPKSLKAGFEVKHIGELNGENIRVTFNEVLN